MNRATSVAAGLALWNAGILAGCLASRGPAGLEAIAAFFTLSFTVLAVVFRPRHHHL